MIRRYQLASLLLAALLLGACLDALRRPQKAPGSALWLDAEVPPPETSQLARLKERGVGELFLDAGTLELGSRTLEPSRLPDVPSGTPATLVIDGLWAPDLRDYGDAAKVVAERVRQLRFGAEARGLLPVGYHFDLRGVDDVEGYGRFLDALRGELDRALFLSASVRRGWIDDPGLKTVTDAADFVVPFLYGQRQREREDADAWDFIRLERSLQTLEALGARYMVGLITLGTATLHDRGGDAKARTTRLSLQDLLWNRRLKLRAGFSLEGVNRQVYTVVAERTSTVGDWSLRPGDSVRVVRPATSHVEEFLRLRGAWNLQGLLGQVYFRVPAPGERLSLSVENLLNGLDPTPATPDLGLDVRLQRGTGHGWLFRMILTNRNGEVTALSLIDSNYVQLRTDRGRFGRVDVGDFYRFVLFRAGEDGSVEQTFREANVLRLHLPLLEGEQSLTSGDIEIRAPGSRSGAQPVLTLEAGFILTDGRSLTLGPLTWRRGAVQAASEPAGAADDG